MVPFLRGHFSVSFSRWSLLLGSTGCDYRGQKHLPHLLSLSRQAIRAIKQNVIFSLGVLAIAIGLALVGVLSPVTGALLHELSSIPVIANSARLIGLRDHDKI
jgi:hypothetical protein